MPVYVFSGIRHCGDSRLKQGSQASQPAHRARSAYAQPQERRRHAAGRKAGHHHWRQRIGEVVARLRHHLRRRTAPVRRVVVGVRAAVPRAHGEAGRRSHRGHLSGDRHSSEEQRPQPALDRRHDDRNPRLHATAVRARGPNLLPAVRPGGHPRNGRGRGETTRRAARGYAPPDRLRDSRRLDFGERRHPRPTARTATRASSDELEPARDWRRRHRGNDRRAPAARVRAPARRRQGGRVRGDRPRDAQARARRSRSSSTASGSKAICAAG